MYSTATCIDFTQQNWRFPCIMFVKLVSLQVLMPFTCGYCPTSSSQFKETINHLVTSHSEKEIKMKKLDGTALRTLNYQIIPDMCREQGREITLNEHTGTIHVSKPDKVPKDSPFKKLLMVSRKFHHEYTFLLQFLYQLLIIRAASSACMHALKIQGKC